MFGEFEFLENNQLLNLKTEQQNSLLLIKDDQEESGNKKVKPIKVFQPISTVGILSLVNLHGPRCGKEHTAHNVSQE